MRPSISYTIRFVPLHNQVEVTAKFPVAEDPIGELMMAVWTPGSYMLREYARHVTALQAWDSHGQQLPVQKTKKNRWQVSAHGLEEFTVTYALYCHEMTVRTNWVDQEFALLNGAATFVTLANGHHLPHDVMVHRPAQWRDIVTALPGHPDQQVGHFRAEDFDALVDAPIYGGTPDLQTFVVDGKQHVLASEGCGGVWASSQAGADAKKLVEANHALWGPLPYERYVFINLLTEGRGGLEHKTSSVLMASPWATRTRADYLSWLGLVSHEFFHVWNVKRLRPVELGPFDYELETPTRNLWVAEGFTAYYDDLMVCRAGLATPKEYLDCLSKNIQKLQSTPGRLQQSLSDASFDAWIKFYRRDENTDNSQVSYYLKGSLVAFLLDAKIRQATESSTSLDEVMRRAYQEFSGDRGFSSSEFRALAAEVTGVPLSDFFDHAVDGTEELDYAPALETYGLVFDKPEAKQPAGSTPGWLGITTRDIQGRLMIVEVIKDGPGWRAGLNPEDELVAVDHCRLLAARFTDRLKLLPPGTIASLLVSRRERLLRLRVEFGEEPQRACKLMVSPTATPAQTQKRLAWLGRGSAH